MAFKKGTSGNPKGKPKGLKNKHTQAFKDLLTNTIHALEQKKDCGLMAWAEKHPSDFYRICSKLVPQEMVGEFTGDVTIRVIRDGTDS